MMTSVDDIADSMIVLWLGCLTRLCELRGGWMDGWALPTNSSLVKLSRQPIHPSQLPLMQTGER